MDKWGKSREGGWKRGVKRIKTLQVGGDGWEFVMCDTVGR